MKPTCDPHVFTCVPHVLFQFKTFTHMWWKMCTCETHVRSGKCMWISCVSHVTHMNPHVTTCEAHVGSCIFALRSHVKRTCEIGTTHKIHMWISCDFSVRVISMHPTDCRGEQPDAGNAVKLFKVHLPPSWVGNVECVRESTCLWVWIIHGVCSNSRHSAYG